MDKKRIIFSCIINILGKLSYIVCVVRMEDRDEYMNELETAVDNSLDMYIYIV